MGEGWGGWGTGILRPGAEKPREARTKSLVPYVKGLKRV